MLADPEGFLSPEQVKGGTIDIASRPLGRLRAMMNANTRFGRSIIATRFFQRLKNTAAEYVRNPDKLIELVGSARKKAVSLGKIGPLAEIWDSLMALFRLVRAYAKGEYRDIPTSHLLLIVAALLYFLIPTDVIPDFVVGIGLLDDAAVLTWVLATVKTAVDDFLRWESAQRTISLESPTDSG